MISKAQFVASILLIIGGFFNSWDPLDHSDQIIRNNQADYEISNISAPNIFDPKDSGIFSEYIRQTGGEFFGVEIVGDYLYATYSQRLGVYNIVDPAHPKLMGKTEPMTGEAVAVAVSGNYAYLASPGIWTGVDYSGGALRVIDVSNPYHPEEKVFFPAGDTRPSGSPRDLQVQGNYAYILDRDRGLWIVDIHEPLVPSTIKVVPGTNGLNNLDVAQHPLDGRLYAYMAGGSNYVKIVDVTEPANAVVVASYYTPYPHDIAAYGTYVYVTSGLNIKTLSVVDPLHPSEVGLLPNGDIYEMRIVVSGAYAYIMGYIYPDQMCFQIMSLASPEYPSIISSLSIPIHYWDGFDSETKIDIGLVDGQSIAVLGLQHHGIQLVDATAPENPVEAGKYNEEGYINDVIRQEDYAYTSGKGKLQILRYSSPRAAKVVGSYTFTGKIDSVTDGYAYLLTLQTDSQLSGLRLVNVSNPTAPTQAGFFETEHDPLDVAVYGNFAYLADASPSFKILGITDTLNITEAGHIALGSRVLSVDISPSLTQPGKIFAYVGTETGELFIIDITNPSAPSVTASLNFYVEIHQIAVYHPLNNPHNQEYLVAVTRPERDGVSLIDVSDPTHPLLVDTGYVFQPVWDLTIQGDYVYLAAGYASLQIYHLPNLDEFVGSYRLPTQVFGLSTSGDFITLATGTGGLWDVWFGPGVEATVDPGGGTINSAYDNTNYVFSTGVFTQTVNVEHRPRYPGNTPVTPGLMGIGHFFETSANTLNGQSVQPGHAYTLIVDYNDLQIQGLDESTLALYTWSGGGWIRESSSLVETALNRLTAHPDHFSIWGVFGEIENVFLPITQSR